LLDRIDPAAVTGLSASIANGVVELAWAPSSDETGLAGYRIYRGTQTGTYTAVFTVTNVTNYRDTAVQDGKQYFYSVAALDDAGNEGPRSGEKSVLALVLTGKAGARPNYVRDCEGMTSSDIFAEITADDTKVGITIHDVSGQKVRALVKDAAADLGEFVKTWDLKNDAGDDVVSGLYLAAVKAGTEKVKFVKIIVVRCK
jgi:fibronectin type 3 domain-containing protein